MKFANLLPRQRKRQRRRRLSGYFFRRRRARGDSVLKPYTVAKPLGSIWPNIFFLGFLGLLFFFGIAFAFTVPYYPGPFAIILAVPFALVLWALPDVRNAPKHLLSPLLYALLAAYYLWPNYLAIALPGLPWITVVRLISVPFAGVLIVCISMSSTFRKEVLDAFDAVPYFKYIFLAYLSIEAISIIYSTDRSSSAILFALAQIAGTGTLVAAAVLFKEPGRAERFLGFLCAIVLAHLVVGLWEFRLGALPWAGHIPSFLQINDENVQRFLSGGSRNGAHRVQTIFTTALALGEFVALLAPFTIHFATNRYPKFIRIAGAVSFVCFGLLIYICQSRVGLVGFVITVLTYPLILSYMNWRKKRTSIVSAAIIYASPFILSISAALITGVDAIRLRIFGSGSVQSSTEARGTQWAMGIPNIEHTPWGFGLARGADAVGYSSVGPGGTVSIDTDYLNNLMEYGPVGLLIFMALLVAAPAYSLRGALLAPPEDRELNLFIPLTISFLVYLAARSAYAAIENIATIHLLWGTMIALWWRLRRTVTIPVPIPDQKPAARHVRQAQ